MGIAWPAERGLLGSAGDSASSTSATTELDHSRSTRQSSDPPQLESRPPRPRFRTTTDDASCSLGPERVRMPTAPPADTPHCRPMRSSRPTRHRGSHPLIGTRAPLAARELRRRTLQAPAAIQPQPSPTSPVSGERSGRFGHRRPSLELSREDSGSSTPPDTAITVSLHPHGQHVGSNHDRNDHNSRRNQRSPNRPRRR